MHLGLRHKLLFGLEAALLGAGGLMVLIFPGARTPIWILTALAMLISWISGLITSAKVHGALTRVRRVADAIGRGDFSQRVETQPHDEVAKLARSFNRMANRLEDTVKEQRRLQERLTRSEKLALIGELAATVAHEVNNPLDGLQNCSRIARRNLDDVPQVRRMLDLMDGGLYRIEMIVKRLLSLSKEHVAQLAPTPVDEVVEEAKLFVEGKVAKNHVELVTDLPGEQVYALADRQQLVQALINLMLNAVDSMPEGGRLTVRVPGARRGTLTIAVSDTGGGMTAEEIDHIFEPFYSTKGGRRGTGLGLAIVSRIVDAHHGRIRVRSTVGEGSTFEIELPTIVPEATDSAAAEPIGTALANETGEA